MKATLSLSRRPRNRRRHRRISARARPGPRREALGFEPLEDRLLLSGLSDLPARIVPLLPLPTDVSSQLPSAPVILPPTTGTPRDDSYVLKDRNGDPAVTVDLLWPQGPDPSAGDLIVSDASGRVLYNVPLVGVADLDAKLPIPGLANLVIHLEIDAQGSDTSSSSTGSYQIEIRWVRSSPTPTPAQTLTPASTPATHQVGAPAVLPVDPSGGGATPTPTPSQPAPLPPLPSGITASMNLPAPTSPLPAPVAPIVPPASGSTGGSASGSIVSPAVPVPTRVTASPPVTTSPSSAGSSSASPSAANPSGSPSLDVPIPSASGGGFSAIGDGNRPAVVGPLPLTGSSPDGGIFAYPYNQSKVANDPFRPTSRFAALPEPFDIPARRRSSGFGLADPLDLPEGARSMARLFDLELAAGQPLATGVAFLPPLISFVPARAARPSNQVGASRWPIAYAKVKPTTSLAALILGSAGLFLGLVAPDCVTQLAALQEDRRWKRQFRWAAPKRRPDPTDLV